MIVCAERAGACDELSCNFAAPRQRYWGANTRAHHRPIFLEEVQTHDAGLFLEGERVGHGLAKNRAHSRQHEGGAYVRMSRKRQLRAGREYPSFPPYGWHPSAAARMSFPPN